MRADQFRAHALLEGRHWWFTARRQILLAVAARVTARGDSVLDVGCGTGGNAGAFAAEGFRVVGIDPSADAIGFATDRYSNVQFASRADPEAFASHLHAGGLVLLSDVLEHVEDDADLLRRAVLALPPGGHAVITVPADPTLWSRHDDAFGHYRRYQPESLAALWAALPVSVRLLSHYNALLYPVVRGIRRLGLGGTGASGDLTMPVGPLNRVLHAVFASEASRLLASLDSGTAAYKRGVSLMAVLRREAT